MTLPARAREVLRRGTLCYVSAPSPAGPHVTPLVFVLHGRRLWFTTSRGTVKARAWRREPVAAGLVCHGARGVAFSGRVALYDALDPFTWPAVAFRGPAVALASARFTRKNARFFAGYARDAARVPLSWTPPGRVIASVELDRGAVLDLDGRDVLERWGSLADEVRGRRAFRVARARRQLERRLPEDVRSLVGSSGDGVLGIGSPDAPSVLPVRWSRANGLYYATLPRAFAALAGARPEQPAGLVVDRASGWRASKMRGVLVRGESDVFVPDEIRSGRESLLRAVKPANPDPDDAAVVRLRPDSAVWWSGWSSGTVGGR